jgi:hypothetical protein
MSDAPAWTALALSVGNTGWLGVQGWRARRHRLAAGPSVDTRAALEAAREDCQTVIAVGGADTSWFLDDARRSIDQRLLDLAKRTADEQLAGHLQGAATSLRSAFGHAPTHGPGVYSLMAGSSTPAERQEEAERAERRAHVVGAIREALSAVEAALDRLNTLERRL